MGKRISMVLLTMVIAIITLFIAAAYQTGPNDIAYEEPVGLLLSVGFTIIFFLPPVILSFFNHLAIKIISAIYQAFIAFSFLSIVPIGFIIPSLGIIIIGIVGMIVSISSILITLFVGLKKENLIAH